MSYLGSQIFGREAITQQTEKGTRAATFGHFHWISCSLMKKNFPRTKAALAAKLRLNDLSEVAITLVDRRTLPVGSLSNFWKGGLVASTCFSLRSSSSPAN